MGKYKYKAYNSFTGRSITIMAVSENAARAQAQKKIGTKSGIVRAYRV